MYSITNSPRWNGLVVTMPRPLFSKTRTWKILQHQIWWRYWRSLLWLSTYSKSLITTLSDSALNVAHSFLLNFFFCLSYTASNCEEFGNFLVVVGRSWRCFERLLRLRLDLVTVVIMIPMNDVVVGQWEPGVKHASLRDVHHLTINNYTHFTLARFLDLEALINSAAIRGEADEPFTGDEQRIIRCGVVGFRRLAGTWSGDFM